MSGQALEPMTAADHKAQAEALVREGVAHMATTVDHIGDGRLDGTDALIELTIARATFEAAQVHATLFAGMSSTNAGPPAPWGGGLYG